MKRIAINQSTYIPWRGFFDLFSRCDEYIIYDQVAYSKGRWHNRNRIKAAGGPIWVTIPVVTRSKFEQPIEDVEIASDWAARHWQTIQQSYVRAPFFALEAPRLQALYEEMAAEKLLTNVNEKFIRTIAARLGISTRIVRDREYDIEGTRSERVLSTCKAAGATHYLSGPLAKSYLDVELLNAHSITVEWMDYSGYDTYPQQHGAYDAALSIVDLLLNAGPDAARLIKPFSLQTYKRAG